VISWSEDFSVGVPLLDADHKQIIYLLQELYAVKGPDQQAKAILAKLRVFAEGHFAREEEIMRQYGYPRLEEHQDQHRTFREFIETLDRLREDTANGARPVSEATCQFLEQWIATHTLSADQAFGNFLREQNAPETEVSDSGRAC